MFAISEHLGCPWCTIIYANNTRFNATLVGSILLERSVGILLIWKSLCGWTFYQMFLLI